MRSGFNLPVVYIYGGEQITTNASVQEIVHKTTQLNSMPMDVH